MQFKVIYLDKNYGHGHARRVSVEQCKHKLIALMDSDDISIPNRFELQLKLFSKNSEISIVGGQITEFIGNSKNIIAKRVVPEKHNDIIKYMKMRCPMNQVTVMFKKHAYDVVGGYLDWFCEEDYYLWIRLAINGFYFANVPDTLVNVRVGNEMSSRRGGVKYFHSEKNIQKYLLDNKLINVFQYILNVLIRFLIEVVLPTYLRTFFYKFIRSKYNSKEELNKSFGTAFACYPLFSVAMCVYEKDNPKWFEDALKSVINQTVKPSEIVLVVDGPIPSSISCIIDKYKKEYK